MPPKDNSTHFNSTSCIDTLLGPHSLHHGDYQGSNNTYNGYDGLPFVSFNNPNIKKNYGRGGRINHQVLCALLDMALELFSVDEVALQEMDVAADIEMESSDREEASPTNKPIRLI
jgi:hypothetical protein